MVSIAIFFISNLLHDVHDAYIPHILAKSNEGTYEDPDRHRTYYHADAVHRRGLFWPPQAGKVQQLHQHQRDYEIDMSITSEHLEAAVIDQTVAGQFAGQRYAFVTICGKEYYGLAVAVANDHGYNPISGKKFDSQGEAKIWADGLNRHIGLTDEEALKIVLSTMNFS